MSMVDSLAILPGQFQNQFEPGAADVVVGSLRRKTVEARHFPVGFLADFVRQVGRLQALTEELQLGFALFAAQLLLDGAELLAKDVLPLFLAHFVLGFGGDFTPDFEDLEFVRQVRVDQTQGLGTGFDGEQRVLEGNVHAEHAGEHPRHLQGIDLACDGAGELDRQIHAGVFQNVRGKVDHLAVEGFDLGVRFVRLIGNRNGTEARAQEVVTGEIGERHPLHAQHEDLELVATAAGPLDDGFGGGREKIGRARNFNGRIALGDHENLLWPRWPVPPGWLPRILDGQRTMASIG
jgi:hypothetical protein